MSGESSPRPPSVERLLSVVRPRLGERDRAAVTAAAREVLATERLRLAAGEPASTLDSLADDLVDDLSTTPSALVPVINATGVIIHTNLGRASWPQAAIDAAQRAASGTSFLELDRETGRRGPRAPSAEADLIVVTGGEAALVTNNNAAAVSLALAAAVAGGGRRGGVAVARGELVEIGGGVRIPDVVRRAGLRLVEVGTTNKTRVADYR
ncbi:MAG TPA: hypothetical protein VIF84_03455, partial [Candidatus Limnocylindrales bacterium]